MQPVPMNNAADGRLTFVFEDEVVSFRLDANATLEDIAHRLRELELQHYGDPLAIDITLGRFAACRVD